MFSSLACWGSIAFNIYMTSIMLNAYLPCLVHCIKFDSFEKCAGFGVVSYFAFSAAYGLSGYMLIFGNCRDYHILYHWLLVTAIHIGLSFTLYGYAHKLVNYPLWEWPLVLPGILVSSFVVVILHLLVAKNIIRNRWIRKLIICCIYPTGKIE